MTDTVVARDGLLTNTEEETSCAGLLRVQFISVVCVLIPQQDYHSLSQKKKTRPSISTWIRSIPPDPNQPTPSQYY